MSTVSVPNSLRTRDTGSRFSSCLWLEIVLGPPVLTLKYVLCVPESLQYFVSVIYYPDCKLGLDKLRFQM